MMTDERGLRCLDARRSELALLTGDQPCIEQQEIDRSTSLDQLGEGGLDAVGSFRSSSSGVKTWVLVSAAS